MNFKLIHLGALLFFTTFFGFTLLFGLWGIMKKFLAWIIFGFGILFFMPCIGMKW